MIESLHRRKNGHDYSGRCIYMITIATDQRRQLLGRLVCPEQGGGNNYNNIVCQQAIPIGQSGCVGRGLSSSIKPYIQLSSIGKVVAEIWRNMAIHYTQIEIGELQVMPDHIHGILFVKEKLPVHLGNIIGAYKHQSMKAVLEMIHDGKVHLFSIPKFGDLSSFRLWEPSYHDRILWGKDQLKHMAEYIHDNPRRLWLKRQNSPFFQQFDMEIKGRKVRVLGNRLLMDAKEKAQVRCSRKMSEKDVDDLCRDFIDKGREGAVLVSPFISPGERKIEKAALLSGVSIIKIMSDGFSEFFKPWGLYFDACVEGRLLMVAPFDYSSSKVVVTRAMCEEMNELARGICEG